MSVIIDKRSVNNRSSNNRERFIKRNKEVIKKSIRDNLGKINIDELDSDKAVRLPITEKEYSIKPRYDNLDRIGVGNKTYRKGDSFRKGSEDKGAGKKGSDGEDGEDSFEFVMNKDEFEEYLFDGLELPDLDKKSIKNSTETVKVHAGFKTTGSPANLSLLRSLKVSIGRTLAMLTGLKEEIEKEEAKQHPNEKRIQELKATLENIPFLTEKDLRYRNYQEEVIETSTGVVFCVMDVSGSMTEDCKELAKIFYILSTLFLRRFYDNFELRFIVYTTQGYELTEKEFFACTKNGGTSVSSALKLVDNIIDKEYDTTQDNIYVIHAGDGGNAPFDDTDAIYTLKEDLLPKLNMFINLIIIPSDNTINLNHLFISSFDQYLIDESRTNKKIRCANLTNKSTIYQVFADVFGKQSILKRTFIAFREFFRG